LDASSKISQRGIRGFSAVLAGLSLIAALGPAGAAEAPALGAEDCVRLSLARHPGLAAAAADVDAARSRVWTAGTGYLPKGFFRQSFTHEDIPVESVVRGVDLGAETTRTKNQSFDFHESAFTAQQTLFDFGKTLDSIRSATADRDSVEADLGRERADLVLAVRRAFFTAVAAEAQLQAREASLTQEDEVVKESIARRETELAAEYDVTQSRVRVGLSRLSVIGARKDVVLARESLRAAMGIDEPLDGPLDSDLSLQPVMLPLADAVAFALSARPELRSLESKVRASERRAGALGKEFLPRLAGEAVYGFTGRSFPLDEGWSVGFSATVPIFDSFATATHLGEEKAALAATRARLHRQRQIVEQEVRQTFVELESAAQTIAESARVLEVARRNLELARGRYGEGLGSILEVSDAHSNRTAAEISSVQGLAAHRIARAALERAIARPLE
jgi:outer membrane protein TolC